MTSVLSLGLHRSGGADGLAGDVPGRAGGAASNRITTGGYVEYTMFLAFMVAPIFQVVNVGTQLTEAIAGLDRTGEILGERQEYDEPGRVIDLPPVVGDVRFNEVRLPTSRTSRCCTASRSMPSRGR